MSSRKDEKKEEALLLLSCFRLMGPRLQIHHLDCPPPLPRFFFAHLCFTLPCRYFAGQYEHFRNRESVFKEYKPYFEHAGVNISAVAGQKVALNCGVRNLGDRYVSGG